jgi:hypothetical protein
MCIEDYFIEDNKADWYVYGLLQAFAVSGGSVACGFSLFS